MKTKLFRTITLTALLTGLLASTAFAHPPANGGKPLPPSKAQKELDQARKLWKGGKKAEAEALLAKIKPILASEGRYACCIKGGCNECALEGNCPCGQELSEGKDGEGVCKTCYDGWHNGQGLYDGIAVSEVKLSQDMHGMGDMPAMKGMDGMMGHTMKGMLGDWRMNREASGTSWLPDSSPMYALMGKLGSFDAMLHGTAYGVYTDQNQDGGKRGGSDTYASSQLMGMAWSRVGSNGAGGGIVGGRVMLSADPATMGTAGYPLLFQTGETAFGRPLLDRQHPHDLFMEIAATYSHRLTPTGGFAYVYLAPVGEPALGPTAFPHRVSAFDNPEAPLGHHWFDSTHITYGVATAGVAANSWKVEGSVFTGREPDENRYRFDKMRFDSYSGRITVNPTRDLSAQISHGFLKSPEVTEPGANQQRTTASLTHNLPLRGGKDNLQTSLMWARDRKYELGDNHQSDAYLLEGAYLAEKGTLFGRVERVEKDELFPDSERHPRFTVNKFTVGGVKNVTGGNSAELGVGASISAYALPGGLRDSYGSAPVSVNVFVRLRTPRM